MPGGAHMSDLRAGVEQAAVRALAEAHRIDEAAPQILEGICTALGWGFGALWIVEPSGDALRCIDLWRRDDLRLGRFEELCRELTFKPGQGLPGRVWSTRAPEWILDVVDDSNFPRAPFAHEAGLHSAFGFPIFVRGEVFGVMEFFSYEIHEPDDGLLQMLRTIGSQIGQFVEWEQMERRVEFQKLLLESQGEAALDGIVVIDQNDRILYWNQRFIELWGIPEHVLQAGRHEDVLHEKSTKLVDPASFVRTVRHLAERPDETNRRTVELVDGRIFDRWTAPVRSPDGTTYGRAWFYRDITEPKRLEQQLRESEGWLSFLAEASTILSSSLDYRTTLEALAQLCVPILGDWCAIHVVDPDGEVRPVAIAHVDPAKVDEVRRVEEHYPVDPHSDVGIAGVIRSGTSVLYEEIPSELLEQAAQNEEHLSWLRDLGYHSAMIVPLVCRERVLGSLTFVSSESNRRYSKEDLHRAEDLANRAAFPIDNARLYEARALVARTLQQSLLPPKLPTISGIELAARYQPVAGSADVGGDFYDVFAIGPRSWGVFLGDVSGKGVEAAAVTSLARHTLRTAAMATQRPSEILSMLNAALLEQTERDRFCTAVFALVEPRFGRVKVTVSCGGHPVPYVIRSAGALEPVPCEGTLLGVVPDPELVDHQLELDFGDKIALYTDGILDVRVDGQNFSPQQFEQLLSDCVKRGVKASADLIARTIMDLQGGHARDDFALVIIGVRASIFRRARSPRLWRREREEEEPFSLAQFDLT